MFYGSAELVRWGYRGGWWVGGGDGCLLSEAASRESRRVRAGRHARFALPVDDQLGSRGFMNLLSWCGGGYRGGWCFGVGAVCWGDGGRHKVTSGTRTRGGGGGENYESAGGGGMGEAGDTANLNDR